MSGLLLAEIARDALYAFLQAQMPAAITNVNSERTGKNTLVSIASWTGTPLKAQPETPAIYVIPKSGGFRGTTWGASVDEQHRLFIYVQVGNEDEETAMQDLIGYVAAVVQCLVLPFKLLAHLDNNVQLLFGHGGTDAEDCFEFSLATPVGSTFYADASIAVSAFFSEVP